MAIQPYQEDHSVSNPIKRIRWATQRVTGAKEQRKRHSIIERLHHRKAGSSEKKRESAEGSHLDGIQEETETSTTENRDQEDLGRRIFFNIPLPDDAKDENGHPLAKFARNKIRTAKYTPLSFIPKNLWFQFHNIANIYFLFVIVLAVRDILHPLMLYCADVFPRTVLHHLWRFQPWFRLRTFDSHSLCYCR